MKITSTDEVTLLVGVSSDNKLTLKNYIDE